MNLEGRARRAVGFPRGCEEAQEAPGSEEAAVGSPAGEQIAKAHGCSERRRKQPQIVFGAGAEPSEQARGFGARAACQQGAGGELKGGRWGRGSRGPLLALSRAPGDSRLDRTRPPGPRPPGVPARLAGEGRGVSRRVLPMRELSRGAPLTGGPSELLHRRT